MLDFLLVLGQIPGTPFQITFWEYSVFWSTLGVIVFRSELWVFAVNSKRNIIKFTIYHYWRRRQMRLKLSLPL
jgi:hypothetical protein